MIEFQVVSTRVYSNLKKITNQTLIITVWLVGMQKKYERSFKINDKCNDSCVNVISQKQIRGLK